MTVEHRIIDLGRRLDGVKVRSLTKGNGIDKTGEEEWKKEGILESLRKHTLSHLKNQDPEWSQWVKVSEDFTCVQGVTRSEGACASCLRAELKGSYRPYTETSYHHGVRAAECQSLSKAYRQARWGQPIKTQTIQLVWTEHQKISRTSFSLLLSPCRLIHGKLFVDHQPHKFSDLSDVLVSWHWILQPKN